MAIWIFVNDMTNVACKIRQIFVEEFKGNFEMESDKNSKVWIFSCVFDLLLRILDYEKNFYY